VELEPASHPECVDESLVECLRLDQNGERVAAAEALQQLPLSATERHALGLEGRLGFLGDGDVE